MFAVQEGHIGEISDVEGRPTETQDLPGQQNHEAETVGFLLRDQSSYLHTNRMRELEKGDTQVLLDLLEDPSFFYAIQLDDEEQVTNIFWADPQSIIGYAYFGDVVLFDTTYPSSKNDIPVALFLGINHHKQSFYFGAALLLDETTNLLFGYLGPFWLQCLNRSRDQGAAISRAVSMTLLETCHRICLWHISQNAAKNISHLHSSETTCRKEFKNRIYEGNSEDDFLAGWMNLINN